MSKGQVAYAQDFGSRQGRILKRFGCEAGDGSSVPIPRIARLLALAIRLEALIRQRRIRDYAEIARRGRVSRARMSQIVKLLDLAPDIQEQIPFYHRVLASASGPPAPLPSRSTGTSSDLKHCYELRRKIAAEFAM
jgi:hypothetical protein